MLKGLKGVKKGRRKEEVGEKREKGLERGKRKEEGAGHARVGIALQPRQASSRSSHVPFSAVAERWQSDGRTRSGLLIGLFQHLHAAFGSSSPAYSTSISPALLPKLSSR